MSFLDKAKEIGTAALGLAKLAFGGYDNTQVSEDVYQARIAACKAAHITKLLYLSAAFAAAF